MKNSVRRWMRGLKTAGRAVVCAILEAQVQSLRMRHKITVIAVVGSVGKTSTKAAIAKTLQTSRHVAWQEGNYNDRVTVPLIFFGQREPNILNVFSWLRVFWQNGRMIRGSYPYDVVVVEAGTDGPGQMQRFAYLQPDLAVVTAVVPEHMEYFGTLEAVATEELSILNFSKQALVNTDDTPAEFLKGRKFLSYSLDQSADYRATKWQQRALEAGVMTVQLPDSGKLEAPLGIVGKPGAKVELAAAAVAHIVGLSKDDIGKGLANVQPFAGRMQILEGIQDSIIIDDTYNASPSAVEAGLDVLYAVDAPQRVAILGSMNQMGAYSPEAHREIGAYCDPKKLDWVVTIGADAQKYLAPAAQKAGCQVKSFSSPYEAGDFVKSQLKSSGVVLGEGSQDGVYAEEALKVLLKDPAHQGKLVRQSPYWMNIKRERFPASQA